MIEQLRRELGPMLPIKEAAFVEPKPFAMGELLARLRAVLRREDDPARPRHLLTEPAWVTATGPRYARRVKG